MVVHFDLILADKSIPPRTAAYKIIWESRRDGFLEMQSLENVRIVVLKKNPRWRTLILANKALHDYSFPVIFSNISEGLF